MNPVASLVWICISNPAAIHRRPPSSNGNSHSSADEDGPFLPTETTDAAQPDPNRTLHGRQVEDGKTACGAAGRSFAASVRQHRIGRGAGAGGMTILGEEGRMKTQPNARAKLLVNFKAASVGTIDGTPTNRSTDNSLRSRVRRAAVYTTNCLSSVSLSE
jgi:hypothetical protein